jgi:hypothetical protein
LTEEQQTSKLRLAEADDRLQEEAKELRIIQEFIRQK